MVRRLVAGVDTSTQSCKVRVTDAETGDLVRFGQAKHPNGTSIIPRAGGTRSRKPHSMLADWTTWPHWPLAANNTAWWFSTNMAM